MAEISTSDGHLVVSLSTGEKVVAAHGDIRVPLAAVVGVQVLDDAIRAVHPLRLSGLRFAGAYLPGVVAIGTFLDGAWSRRLFAVVHRGTRRGVRIDLAEERFSALVVGCEDPEGVVERLRAPEAA